MIKRLGLSSKTRVRVGSVSIAPRDLVVSLLPEPKDLAGRMRGKVLVDLRNAYDREQAEIAGLEYFAIGRGPRPAAI